MKYGYARVATASFNSNELEAQKQQLIKEGAEVVYSEVGSGNQINSQLQLLLDVLKNDDIIIISNVSRLGRNESTLSSVYKEIFSKNANIYDITFWKS